MAVTHMVEQEKSGKELTHQNSLSGALVEPPSSPELRALLDLEFARIASVDKRTALLEKAIEAQDAQDQREFEFHSTASERLHKLHIARLGAGKSVFFWGGAIVTTMLGISVWMLFWGSDAQSEIAAEAIKLMFVGLGGYGVGTALRVIVRSVLSSRTGD